MSTIRKEETLLFASVADAQRYVRNLEGRPRFQVMVHAFLPINEERGFDGQTCISISRAQFLDVLAGVGRTLVDSRGASIRLHVTPADRDNGLSFVALH